MTTDAEDRSTWPRKRRVIRRDELLRLIEKNRGPKGLDLRGATFVGDGPSDDPHDNPIDLRPQALEPLAEAYREANGGSAPRWLSDGSIDLSKADLQETQLCRARLQQADLSGTQLQDANLALARLDEANLPGAQLQRANVTGVQLQEANLWDAKLEGADMYGVASLVGAHWHGTFLDHTRINRESLGTATGDETLTHGTSAVGDYHRAKEAYLLLKNNFNQIGRYEDSSWAYVKEQQMEKMAYYWEWHSHGWKVWRAWGSLSRWLRNWAYELLTGYGERPWNAVGAGLAAILAFGVGFWAAGIGGGRGALAFLDCLVYSIATFATFNLARPELNPQGRGIEIASSLEAILGISVLALVVFTVGNRMSRS